MISTPRPGKRAGSTRSLDDVVAEVWRPFRSLAAVPLRTLREQRTHEINGLPNARNRSRFVTADELTG